MRCAVLVLFLLGCGPYFRPDPLPDSATLQQQCDAACDNMARLQYPGWEGATDAPCSQVCVDTERAGFPFHAPCLARAATKAEMDGCYQ